jgi:polar amino acid transport system substrate-binding protein
MNERVFPGTPGRVFGMARRLCACPRRAALCLPLCLILLLVVAAPGVWAGPLRLYTEKGRPFQIDETGAMSGFTVEVVREALRRTGSKGTIELLPWKRGYLEAKTDPDSAIFPVYRIAEREQDFLWSEPLLKAKWILYRRKGSLIRLSSLDDARRLDRIAVSGGDARMLYMESRGFSNLQVVPVDLFGWKMLVDGRVDLVAGSNLAHLIQDQEYASLMPRVEPALVMDEYTLNIAFCAKADPELVRAWNSALRGMVRDGTYAALYRRHFQTDEYSPYPLPAVN